jgi:hypothetical protein
LSLLSEFAEQIGKIGQRAVLTERCGKVRESAGLSKTLKNTTLAPAVARRRRYAESCNTAFDNRAVLKERNVRVGSAADGHHCC